MKILAVGQVENSEQIVKEIEKQTIKPDRAVFYVDENPAELVDDRRQRIAKNHEKLVRIVSSQKPDLVWQVEGDSVLPDNCLERLLEHYEKLKDDDFGFVSGIQAGRHGLYCLGAWHVADDRQTFSSIDPRLKGLQQIDGAGWYCMLAPRDVWLSGTAFWDNEGWGPDVNWCLTLGKRKKYVDMDLHIGHRTKAGIIAPDNISVCKADFYRQNGHWKYKTN